MEGGNDDAPTLEVTAVASRGAISDVDDILAELDAFDKVETSKEAHAAGGGPAREKEGAATPLQAALQQVRDGAASLDLSDYRIRLGPTGCIALAEALSRPRLQVTTVLLNNCDITACGATSIGEALRINPTVTKLDMNSNQICDAGATALADALRANETVRWLDLENNGINCGGAAALSEALKTNQTVTLLHLSGNNIGDTGATSVAKMLPANRALVTLWLDHNNISGRGGAELNKAAAGCTALQTLHLGTPKPGSLHLGRDCSLPTGVW